MKVLKIDLEIKYVFKLEISFLKTNITIRVVTHSGYSEQLRLV